MASHFIFMTTTATTTSTKLLCFFGRNPAVMGLVFFLNICTVGLLSGLSPALGSGIEKEPHTHSGLQSVPLRLYCSASEWRGSCVVPRRKPLSVHCSHRSGAGDRLSGACVALHAVLVRAPPQLERGWGAARAESKRSLQESGAGLRSLALPSSHSGSLGSLRAYRRLRVFRKAAVVLAAPFIGLQNSQRVLRGVLALLVTD